MVISHRGRVYVVISHGGRLYVVILTEVGFMW